MEDFLFADEPDDNIEEAKNRKSWKVLIVDDDPEIHSVTKLALNDFEFQDRKLEFISAMSGEQARQMLTEHNDIAVVLLDVVMETDHAGLEVARFIREDLNNYYTRIILRTGQPGQAPERHVIINYDINDYKSKTDLTAQKLFTVIISTLRSYRDIVVIDENRRGLEKIIKSSANLFSIHSLEHFIEGIVQQLSSLLGGTQEAVYMTAVVAGPLPIDNVDDEKYYVFSGCGEYTDLQGKPLEEVVQGEKLASCKQALSQRDIVYGPDHVVAYCESKSNRGAILYMSGLQRSLNELDRHLIELFSLNVQIAFDNILKSRDIEETQKEIIDRLGRLIHAQNEVGSQHTRRMQGIADILAAKLGLDDELHERMVTAIPLYDIGKLTLSRAMLNKRESLSDDEFEKIKTHAQLGYEILKDSNRPLIKTAALLARDHHEHWDGSGYPNGLAGDNIFILSRITALASVYDVLRSDKAHKSAWDQQTSLAAIRDQRGKQFDPELVDLLTIHIDEVEAVRAQFPDE